MKWQEAQKLSNSAFRRLTGVKIKVFKIIVDLVEKAYAIKHAKGGRPHSLCRQDMALMMLEYLREYRTYFHIGASYGLAESNAFQTIKWIEDVLIQSKLFSLPSRKELASEAGKGKKVVVDVVESPIERPKKNSACTTQARKNATL
jgi:Helix-turn-helix of DDE superfamily endonuclease